MGSLISKFNLYELFRILIPGFYIVFMVYICIGNYIKTQLNEIQWPETTLLVIVFSLIWGGIVFALDIPRFLKGLIKNMPTSLLKENHNDRYGKYSERMLEHIYYEWYENTNIKSKTKTELLSSIYHLAVNFAAISSIGIVVGAIILINSCCKTSFPFISNLILFFSSTLLAIIIVMRRLNHQWFRNYLEFRDSNIPKSF